MPRKRFSSRKAGSNTIRVSIWESGRDWRGMPNLSENPLCAMAIICKFMEKNDFFVFFCKKICVYQKNVVLLHPLSLKTGDFAKGTLAQVVEQWTENPCVLGSTPRGTTANKKFGTAELFLLL